MWNEANFRRLDKQMILQSKNDDENSDNDKHPKGFEKFFKKKEQREKETKSGNQDDKEHKKDEGKFSLTFDLVQMKKRTAMIVKNKSQTRTRANKAGVRKLKAFSLSLMVDHPNLKGGSVRLRLPVFYTIS